MYILSENPSKVHKSLIKKKYNELFTCSKCHHHHEMALCFKKLYQRHQSKGQIQPFSFTIIQNLFESGASSRKCHIHICKIFMNMLQAAAILAFSTTCSRFEKILNNNKLRRLDFSFQMMATGILLVLMIYINDPRFKL